MKSKLINPNTTQSMTDGVQNIAEMAAAPGTEVYAVSPKNGPASLAGYADQAIAAPGVLEEVIKGDYEEGADAFIIACFGDPGLQAAKMVTDKPVIGMAQAAMLTMRFLAPNFTIIGNLFGGTESRCEALRRYGCENIYQSGRFIGMSVLDVEKDPAAGLEALRREIKLAIEEDKAEGIILGCAGFVPFVDTLRKEFSTVPILDGITPAVKIAESLVSMGCRTSKIRTYGYPANQDVPGYEFMKAAQKKT